MVRTGFFFLMIQVLVFASHIRGVHKGLSSNPFYTVIKRAINILPPVAQGFCAQMLPGSMMPSPATVRRCRLFVDVTYMRRMQQVHHAMIADGGVCFGLMDSSPQGRDYLMHRYRYLSLENVQTAADLATDAFQCRCNKAIYDVEGFSNDYH